jgi:hypothetical protein
MIGVWRTTRPSRLHQHASGVGVGGAVDDVDQRDALSDQGVRSDGAAVGGRGAPGESARASDLGEMFEAPAVRPPLSWALGPAPRSPANGLRGGLQHLAG